MDIFPGLLTIMTTHFLGVISPGPDFAIVVKNSLTKPRKQALFTTLGVSTGLLIHISYCIFGLGLLISNSPKIFASMKVIGGGYLLYLGLQSIRTAKAEDHEHSHTGEYISDFQAFLEGLLCNIFNVKAILFILFLFSIVIKPHTPLNIKILYGIVMVIITLAWFSALTFLISIPKFKQQLFKFHKHINIIFGIILSSLGIYVLIPQ
jgi:RhtB (resistance to homoserine/threonine) family protein